VVDTTVDPQWLAATRETLEPFHDLLATEGTLRGLIGPREAARLWERHLLNCAAVADPHLTLVKPHAQIVDIGSGAGLPGLVWALVRTDVSVTLVEPLQRRASFLSEAIDQLNLSDRVKVVNSRAQDVDVRADVVTSRAVSALPEIMSWSAKLCRPGGHVIAMKGARAAEELVTARETIPALVSNAEVVRIGPMQPDGHPWATVVVAPQ